MEEYLSMSRGAKDWGCETSGRGMGDEKGSLWRCVISQPKSAE